MIFIKEVGTPKRKLVQSREEYINFIKKYNGVTNLYETVYNYKFLKNKYQPDYDSAVLDKMFFDADSRNSLQTTIKFHKFLLSRNIKHYIKQSSYMRFHIMVLCDSKNVENKKAALTNAMVELCNEAGLTFGQASESDFDKATFGDLARLTRIAGTYNIKRKCWCNYITEKDLYDIERLKEKASKFGGRKIYYGEKLFDLKPFDKPITEKVSVQFEFTKFNAKFEDKYVDVLPPFIKKILLDYNGYGNWINRWRFAILCRNLGYPPELTNEIARKYFSKVKRTDNLQDNYEHFCKVRIIKQVYEKEEKYKFPPVGKLVDEGYEIEDKDIDFFNKYIYF